MSTVARRAFQEEEPTKRIENLSSRTILRIERIKRLAETCTELLTHPSGPRVASAVCDLATIRATALEVLS